MSNRKISLSIVPATETTCGNGDGNFCPHLRVKNLGTVWVCSIWEGVMEEKDGWLQRRSECLAAEKEGKSERTRAEQDLRTKVLNHEFLCGPACPGYVGGICDLRKDK